MNKLYGENSKFVFYGSKVWDLMYLNVLAILCALPIVTLGPSLTAMHYVLLRIYRDQDCGISRDFFHAFRRDFLPASLTGLIYLAVGAALAFDYLAVIRTGMITGKIYLILFYIIVFLYLFSLTWVFVLLSRYRETVVSLIRDSFLLGTGYLFYTLLMMALTLFPLILLALFPRLLPVILLFCLAGSGFLQAMIYSRVFQHCESVDNRQAS